MVDILYNAVMKPLAFRNFCLGAVLCLLASFAAADELRVGATTVDITPQLPVSLDGQMALRVASKIETPLEANVLVLESLSPQNTSVWVTCDIVTIPTELLDLIRKAVRARLPRFNTRNIMVNASHTHTGGVVRANWYPEPDSIVKVTDYQHFIAEKVAEGIENAWITREKCTVSWGIGYAKVAYNRRARYEDGTARMYGKTHGDDFRKIEGYEDQSINTLFFWNPQGALKATCINVASPAQIVESRYTVNADYWHPLREILRKEHHPSLVILGWVGAAGDQTPRPMYEHSAEARMLRLRYGEPGQGNDFRTDVYLKEIARRIAECVNDTYRVVQKEKHENVTLAHQVLDLNLPMRPVKEVEVVEARKMQEEDLADPIRATQMKRRIAWQQEVIDRFEMQKTIPNPKYPVEIHVIRLGDIAIASNPFELFTEYGVQMKARSKSLQTFVVQLVGPGTYLPTRYAEEGGHYSAIVQSVRVGPEGGQLLVDKTVEQINRFWP